MNILALDTCSKSLSCAVQRDSILVGEFCLELSTKHSVTLLPTIDKLLKLCEMSIEEIDLFACTTGPGSFTGQRIGISTILGLADAQNKPVFGISTLEVLALNIAIPEFLISPIIDARNNQVYTVLYKFKLDNINILEVESPIAINIDEWFKILKNHKDKIIFVGDILQFEGRIIEVLGDHALFSNNNLIRASNIARIANLSPEKWVSTSELGPIYFRKSQAERKRDE